MTETTEPTDASEVPDPEPPHGIVEPWDAERAAAEGIEVDTEPATTEAAASDEGTTDGP